MAFFWAVFCWASMSLSAALAARAVETPAGSCADTITADELIANARLLASAEFGGRLPGTAGYDSAASWAARSFARCGLRWPGGGVDYWQRFTIETNRILSPCRLALVRGGPDGSFSGMKREQPLAGVEREWNLGADFVCRGFSGSGAFTAPVAFVGYGLSLPELGYDDYSDVDVAGKVVLAFKPAPTWLPAAPVPAPPPGAINAPGDAPADSTAVAGLNTDRAERTAVGWGDAHLPRPKAHAAVAHGAVGLLLVSLPDSVSPQPMIGSVLHGPGEPLPDFPQLHVATAVAEELLADSGWTLAGLRAAIDADRRPRSLSLPVGVRLHVHAVYEAAAPTANVVGILPGRDPVLADEAVVLGAHLDHVGEQAGQVLFPGANDNASGSAAIVAIAEAFARCAAQTPGFPRRTVVFALFAGEEQGLLGAAHYTAHPAVPLERTVAMLNLDCIASGDSLQAGNGKSAPRLWELARQIDADGPGLLVSRTWAGGGADATPFHEAGVPTLYFATTNGYRHLHQPADTVENLNLPLYVAMTRLVARVAATIADGGYERESLGEREAPTD